MKRFHVPGPFVSVLFFFHLTCSAPKINHAHAHRLPSSLIDCFVDKITYKFSLQIDGGFTVTDKFISTWVVVLKEPYFVMFKLKL